MHIDTSKGECYEMDDQKVQKGYSETIKSDSEGKQLQHLLMNI